MAWYEDIKALTERSPEERSNFLRGHGRSLSRSSQRSSQRSSLSSDGVDDDEDPPFLTDTATVVSVNQQPKQDALPRRPSGGRFPSDLQVNAQRGLQVPRSPLSVSSGYNENNDGDAFAGSSGQNASGPQDRGLQEPGLEYANRMPRDEHAVITSTPVYPDYLGGQPLERPGSTNHERSDLKATIPCGDDEGATWTGLRQTAIGSDGAVGIQSPVLSPESDIIGERRPIPQDPEVMTRQFFSETEPRVLPDGGEETRGNFNGTVYQGGKPTRPPGAAIRTDSVPTISHLHIPGEYPTSSPAGFP
jgi:hypothetical protein